MNILKNKYKGLLSTCEFWNQSFCLFSGIPLNLIVWFVCTQFISLLKSQPPVVLCYCQNLGNCFEQNYFSPSCKTMVLHQDTAVFFIINFGTKTKQNKKHLISNTYSAWQYSGRSHSGSSIITNLNTNSVTTIPDSFSLLQVFFKLRTCSPTPLPVSPLTIVLSQLTLPGHYLFY